MRRLRESKSYVKLFALWVDASNACYLGSLPSEKLILQHKE
jgi:hypothetical protein